MSSGSETWPPLAFLVHTSVATRTPSHSWAEFTLLLGTAQLPHIHSSAYLPPTPSAFSFSFYFILFFKNRVLLCYPGWSFFFET